MHPLHLFPLLAALTSAWKIHAWDKTLSCDPGDDDEYRVITGTGNVDCHTLSSSDFPSGVTCKAYTEPGDKTGSCSKDAKGKGGDGLYGSIKVDNGGKKITFFSGPSCDSRLQLGGKYPNGDCGEALGEADFNSFTVS